MHYAFVDESGTDAPFSGSSFLILALLCTTRRREIELSVTRARRKYGASLASGEMKADASPPKVIEYLLGAIADMPIEIMAIVVDKRCIRRPPSDGHKIYRTAAVFLTRHAVARWPNIEICFDKRYTSPDQRARFEKTLHQGIADLPQQMVSIHQEDSATFSGLQAVDYVAWALFQKYERSNSGPYRIIAERIVVEELIAQEFW